ncbi:MAG: hypothetical protein COB08_001735 [Rhodobacteraceae bacterium]|nr:hypothetical protein [Paracoccaceae bacterium]
MTDKTRANLAGFERINVGLKFSRTKQRIAILRGKYLNNFIEQNHHFLKKITRPHWILRPSIQPRSLSPTSRMADMTVRKMLGKPHGAVCTFREVSSLNAQ